MHPSNHNAYPGPTLHHRVSDQKHKQASKAKPTGTMREQQSKKVDDWLDKMESYQYRVKSVASPNAILFSQVCSLRHGKQNLQTSYHQDPSHSYSEPAHQVQRVRQAPRHDHQAQAREDRHHPALEPAVIQSFRPKTVKINGTG